MHMKKLIAIGAMVVMSSACIAFPAFAHGHHRQAQTTVNYPALCTVEGCAETGRHTHNGVDYCGYNHGCGYCDGSCVTQTNTNYSGHHGHHGHHGCH